MYTMILDGSYPNDIRVRKEAESLSNAGHKLMVICRWKKGEKRIEEINNVLVHRIGKNYTFTRKGFNDILLAFFFIDFSFRKSIKRILQTQKISAFHVHDLPLIKTVLKVDKNIPIILDMHENYPEMLESLRHSNKSLAKRIKDFMFFGFKKWKKYEKKYIFKADHIIAVIDEMKEKLIREYGINENKISIISNYEKVEFTSNTLEDDFQFNPNSFYIVYVGGIDFVRGLNTVVEALPFVKDLHVEFIIVGGGNNNYIEYLKRLSVQLNCSESVHFMGYKQFEKINYYINNSQLSVIPHIKNEHTNNTIPHKMFQIMLSKSPLLVSSCIPLKRIVQDNDAGYVFEASNPQSFVTVLKQIIDNREEVSSRVEKAYQLVKTKLNWDNESEKLINLYIKYNGQKN